MTSDRLRKLRGGMHGEGLDALVVLQMDNLRYLTGFTGSTGGLIITPDEAIMLVDGRYTVQASQECPNVQVRGFRSDLTKAIVEEVASLTVKRIGFERDAATYHQYQQLRALRGSGKSLKAERDLVGDLRAVKDDSEVALIRRAVEIADECFAQIAAWLRPGLSEQEVAAEIDYRLRRLGADKSAFDTIVASGPKAALPHAKPTDRRLQQGNLVILDFGAECGQYPSDLTRTVCIGKADAKQREIYGVVLEAQQRAIRAIRPGARGRDVDAVARDHIAEAGYGENFGHGLGHGLGRGVHDGRAFSTVSEAVLKNGMIVTVEPGIYIENWGGVRIEDNVLVTDDGCEVLTRAAKELIEVTL